MRHTHNGIDLLQVDLLASGLSLFAGRERREVDLSRLQGFHLHFVPKMGSGVTRIWGFRFHMKPHQMRSDEGLFESLVMVG